MWRLCVRKSIIVIASICCLCPLGAQAVRYGADANNTQFPSVVEFYKKATAGFIVGSGVLYRPDIVITAAHVVKGWVPGSTQVVKWNGKTFGIAQVILNPHLKDGDDVDLAVVKLTTPIDAQTATLSSDVPAAGQSLIIAGFGQDGNENEANNGLGKLRSGTAVFDSFKNSGSFVNGTLKLLESADNTIACEGDSGGPAFVNGQVVGIFYGYVFVPATAKNTCAATVSTTYISVPAFRDWIDATTSMLEGSSSSQQASLPASGFYDVPDDAWFAQSVDTLTARGIISGYTDSQGNSLRLFGPADPVTYAELAKMAILGAQLPAPQNATAHNPSAQGQWSQPYIAEAENLDFAPYLSYPDVNTPMTRAEAVQTLLQAFGITIQPYAQTYSDVSADTPYADAITTATNLGIVQGDTDANGNATGMFRPDDPINRAEISKILVFMINHPSVQ